MKTKMIISTMLIATMTICASATKSNAMTTDNNRMAVSLNEEEKEEETVTRQLPLRDFSAIDCDVAMNIEYTQGATYKVEVTGTPSALDNLKAEVNKKCLTFGKVKKLHIQGHVQSVACRITAPTLTHIVGSSVIKVDMPTAVTVGDFQFKSNGVGKLIVADMTCKDFSLEMNGTGKTLVSLRKAGKVSIENNGASHVEMTANAESLNLENNGAGRVQTDFTGKTIDVENNGAGRISLAVDCKQLRAENNGIGKFSISGTADDVNVSSSGMSRVDVSKLNK